METAGDGKVDPTIVYKRNGSVKSAYGETWRVPSHRV